MTVGAAVVNIMWRKCVTKVVGKFFNLLLVASVSCIVFKFQIIVLSYSWISSVGHFSSGGRIKSVEQLK